METLLQAGLSNAITATLMAVLVTGLSRPLARRPAILHGLWLLVLIRLVIPPFYAIPVPWPLPAEHPPGAVREAVALEVVAIDELTLLTGESEPDPAGRARAAGAGESPRRSTPGPQAAEPASSPLGIDRAEAARWIGATWLAGSAVVLLVSLRRVLRFQRWLKEAREASGPEQAQVDKWARRLGLRDAPDLRWVPGPVSPMIWFVGARPRLIIPVELWDRLDAHQRSTLIAHELAHVRRKDHLVRLLELLVTALFWWHPLVWWMRGPLRDAEEQCCDAWVVWALPDAARAYAETLLDTLEFLQQSGRPDPLLASGLGKVPHLRRRLTMIMTGAARRSPGLAGKLGLLLVAGAVLPVGASWAQKADVRKEPGKVVIDAETIDVLGPAELKTITGDAPADAAVVVVRVDDRPESVRKVELSGSLDDVVKKLEARIAELKKVKDPSDAARAQVKALEQALEALKKTEAQALTLRLHVDDPKTQDLQTARLHFQGQIHKDGPSGDKARKIANDRKALLTRLKEQLKATVEQIGQVQAELRELGEDPGETPTIGWSHAKGTSRAETRTVVVRKVDGKLLEPSRAETRTFVARKVDGKLLEPHRLRVYVRAHTDDSAPKKVNQLDVLEKKLKDLQQELDRLKKGAAESGEKR